MAVSKGKKSMFKVLLLIATMIFAVIICNLFYVGFEKRYVYPVKFEKEINEYSSKYNLSKTMVYSIIKIESNFKNDVVSRKGAKGLMQIMDATANFIAKELNVKEYDIFNEKTNIEFGCFYLRYLIDKFKDEKLCVLSYNAGEENVRKWLKDSRYIDENMTIKTIPFEETSKYFIKYEKTFNKYRKLYGQNLDKIK